MNPFPVTQAHALEPVDADREWLIEDLWGDEAVGIIGGEPKCGKSLLALDMAVSVSSGRPCLGRFPPRRTGRVLLYAAEDSLAIVRQRLEGIAYRAGLDIAALDLWIITAPTVRLDVPEHRTRLAATVKSIQPHLLILDPFVRLHRIDENASAEVVPLLASLRDLQRTYGCAVLIVHHARKGASRARAGQALRGSSEFHAWSDAGLFLRRRGDDIVLSAEHRAHPAIQDLKLRLDTAGGNVALVVANESAEEPATQGRASPGDRILAALETCATPLSARQLRQHCSIRTSTVADTLATLQGEGRVENSPAGWVLI
ncbi:MAG: AAA family ATPase [bacterium]